MVIFLAMLLGPTIVSPLTGRVMQLEESGRTRAVASTATFGQAETGTTTPRLGMRRGSRVSHRNGARLGGGGDAPSSEAVGSDPVAALESRVKALNDPR